MSNVANGARREQIVDQCGILILDLEEAKEEGLKEEDLAEVMEEDSTEVEHIQAEDLVEALDEVDFRAPT